jgi:hypothetical protein
MNVMICFGILFGVPTILLAFMSCNLDIHNYWQLFLFLSMILIMYMPGMLLLHLAYVYHVKNKVQREFGDLYR